MDGPPHYKKGVWPLPVGFAPGGREYNMLIIDALLGLLGLGFVIQWCEFLRE